jgi:HAD superfamily hydrolase (TIGR01484 family)
MDQFNPLNEIRPSILATDLDGTLIPLDGHPANQADLITLAKLLQEHAMGLIFVTGRPYPSVMQVMQSAKLPHPEWILCDVGTSIYERDKTGNYQLLHAYQDHLDTIAGNVSRQAVVEALAGQVDIELQSTDNQRPHKISYQCDAAVIDDAISAISDRLNEQLPTWHALSSVDPFDGRGLIDILPAGASKAHGLLWLAQHANMDPSAIIFSGDSGNDLAALTAGFRAIVVGNAAPSVVAEVKQQLGARKLSHRLYLAKNDASSGVLQGLHHFLNNS